MRLTAIVAADLDLTIGRGDGIPWDSPADRAHFARITAGKVVILGWRTYAAMLARWTALPEDPRERGGFLPGRRIVVVFRGDPDDAQIPAYGAEVRFAPTPDDAVDLAREWGGPEAVVAGGAAIYAALVSRCCAIYWTRVIDRVVGSDLVRFPFDPFARPTVDLGGFRFAAGDPAWRTVAGWSSRGGPGPDVDFLVLVRAGR